MGLNILRRTRVFFKLFSKRCRKDAQGRDVIFPVAAPYVLRDKGVSQNLADIP